MWGAPRYDHGSFLTKANHTVAKAHTATPEASRRKAGSRRAAQLMCRGIHACFCTGMAHLGGESSNTLFDILAQWNQVLSAIQIPANAPERDICGVAR